MKIASVEAILVDLPTIRPHRLARQVLHQQTLVVVRVKTDDGHEGLGEATTIGGLSYAEESPESIKSAIDRYIAPLVVGLNPLASNAAMGEIERHVVGNRFAKCAIETAILDIKAKSLDVPLHQLLGGKQADRLECLWGLASGDAGKDIEEAERSLSQRKHRAFKIKVGRHDVLSDIAHVTAIAKALGSRASLRIDANQAWDELSAARAISALAGVVDLVEQPIAKTNIEGMARLTARFDVAVMADEAVSTPQDAFAYAKSHAADVFALKIAKSGGVTGVKSVATIAEAGGIGLYGGTMLEGTIGTLASLHVFSTITQPLSFGTELFGPLLLKDDIVVSRPAYSDFSIVVPDAPGLGAEIDEDKLAHYRRDKTRSHLAVAPMMRQEKA
jgi:muconate cycloisomerase